MNVLNSLFHYSNVLCNACALNAGSFGRYSVVYTVHGCSSPVLFSCLCPTHLRIPQTAVAYCMLKLNDDLKIIHSLIDRSTSSFISFGEY